MIKRSNVIWLAILLVFTVAKVQAHGVFAEKDKKSAGLQERKGNYSLYTEKRSKINRHLVTAEAHRGLAQTYELQGKIAEAAKELFKIVDLFKAKIADFKDDENTGRQKRIIKNIFFVYEHIARLYIKDNNEKEGIRILEAAINEYKAPYPEETSRMMLLLSDFYKKKKEYVKAEELYKEVIELNKE